MVTILDTWGRRQGEIDRGASAIDMARMYLLTRKNKLLERWAWAIGLTVAVIAVIVMVVK